MRIPLISLMLVIFLMAGHAAFNKYGSNRHHLPPLLKAASKGNLKAVKQILDADPNAVKSSDSNGHKAIHWAILEGQTHIFLELIRRGHPIDDPDLLLYACSRPYTGDILTHLLEHGINPNQQIGGGGTPLNMAVNNGFDELVDILLSFNACIDYKDSRGRNAIDIVDHQIDFLRAPDTIWRMEANPSETAVLRNQLRMEERRNKLVAAKAKRDASHR